MPEDNPTTGVEVTEVSPTSETHVATVEPPAAEHAVQSEQENKGHVPYFRFKEVNDKMRSYESELAKLRGLSSKNELAKTEKPQSEVKSETSEDDSDSNDEEQMSKYERRLAEEGLDPKASKSLAKVMKEIAKQEAKERIQKEAGKSALRQEKEQERLKNSQKEIAEWQEEFRKAHKDYAEYEPLMQKRWEALDEAGRMSMVSSKKSFELLYEAAKASKLDSTVAEAEQSGRDEAYETQGLKRAVSGTPGATVKPGKKYTAEDVGNMTKEEYTANKAKIMVDLGLLKEKK